MLTSPLLILTDIAPLSLVVKVILMWRNQHCFWSIGLHCSSEQHFPSSYKQPWKSAREDLRATTVEGEKKNVLKLGMFLEEVNYAFPEMLLLIMFYCHILRNRIIGSKLLPVISTFLSLMFWVCVCIRKGFICQHGHWLPLFFYSVVTSRRVSLWSVAIMHFVCFWLNVVCESSQLCFNKSCLMA